MNYTIFLHPRAEKELEKIPKPDRERIGETIWSLEENPRPQGYKKLVHRVGFRIRSGNYRIVYDIDDDEKTVIVQHVGDRKDVYR